MGRFVIIYPFMTNLHNDQVENRCKDGVIRMDLRNIVEEFLNVTKCKSLSGVKHQISCKFIAGEF